MKCKQFSLFSAWSVNSSATVYFVNNIWIIFVFRSAGSLIGSGTTALLTDWDKVLAAAGGISLIALGVYTAKGATSVTARYIEARLGKFHLVIM